MKPVGVIPAAGRAERLQPLPCSKEVYPVGGRPVMDYVVERLRAADCRELRFVTRPDKADVVEHARELRAEVVMGEPPMLEQLDEAAGVVLGVFESDEPERSDVVVLDERGRVRRVHVKEADPPGHHVWGCFAARVGALAGLESAPTPGHYFAGLAVAGTVRAVSFPGRMVDIGTPEALAAVEAEA
jgi:NDP-sugar pyrophosphorylase family protein